MLWKYKNKKGELVKLKKLRKVDNHGGWRRGRRRSAEGKGEKGDGGRVKKDSRQQTQDSRGRAEVRREKNLGRGTREGRKKVELWGGFGILDRFECLKWFKFVMLKG